MTYQGRAPAPQTLFEKVWHRHVVSDLGNNTSVVHIDRNFMHEMSGGPSLQSLERRGLPVRNKELTFATLDHVLDTMPGRTDQPVMPGGRECIMQLRRGCEVYGLRLYDLGSPHQGIVHVTAPELGVVLPGSTVVCGDSHTCTLGALGAFAFGIGGTDSEIVLASQVLVISKPETMRVTFDGRLAAGVTAKDLVLYLIGKISADGGNNAAIEFAGEAIRGLPLEGRMTICNMAVELSGRAGMVAPDDVTFEYLHGRPFAPTGKTWDAALAHWHTLPTDEGARFDREVTVDAATVTPQITWGVSPEHVVGIEGCVPNPGDTKDAHARAAMEKAIAYTGLKPGQPVKGLPVNAAFIGSCTNSRVSDLRSAARILKGRKVAAGVKAICVPGSMQVKREAEAEGIADIFKAAGFEWREPGCSLCMSSGAGGEAFAPQSRVVSSTNRNFPHRQGKGVISHLASPETVALSAIHGALADVREL